MTCHNCRSSCQRFGRNRNGTQRYRCPDCRKTFSDQRSTPLQDMYLSPDRARMVLHLFVEGNSVRSVERLTGVHHDTIFRLLTKVGAGCEELLRHRVRRVPVQDVQFDEVWTFVQKKQRRVEPEDGDLVGDAYLFIALERHTKIVLTWHLGKRDQRNTDDFVTKVRDATTGTFQLTTDGFAPYRYAIAAGLADRCDYAQQIKLYGSLPGGREHYRPAKIRGSIAAAVIGNPSRYRICTSHVERKNGTLRQWCKRFTRLTYAFSKKWANLEAAIALHMAHYNFCRIHGSLRVTPAIESGLTDHVWTLDELIQEAVA